MRTVAAFGAEDRVMASFEVALQAPAASAEAAAVTSGFSQAFAQAMTSLPTAFVFYVGAIYIQHHILTFEQGACSTFQSQLFVFFTHTHA